MRRPKGQAATAITRFTRVVLSLDLLFSLVAGGVLYGLSTRTEEYFAWTINSPLTATFLGAGYIGAAATLVPSYRTIDWRRIRIIPVMGVTLTAVTAVVTLRYLDQFHLGEGSATARLAGWAWLVVYLAIPVLLAAVFLRQEGTSTKRGHEVEEPLLPLLRVALVVQAVGATVLGVGLVLWPNGFDVLWPWPLPALSAGAVGAWLLTIAAGCWWALRDGDWLRFRIGVPGLIAFLGLVGVGALRYPEALDAGDWQEWVFLAGLVVATAVFASAGLQQERRAGRLSRVRSEPGPRAATRS